MNSIHILTEERIEGCCGTVLLLVLAFPLLKWHTFCFTACQGRPEKLLHPRAYWLLSSVGYNLSNHWHVRMTCRNFPRLSLLRCGCQEYSSNHLSSHDDREQPCNDIKPPPLWIYFFLLHGQTYFQIVCMLPIHPSTPVDNSSQAHPALLSSAAWKAWGHKAASLDYTGLFHVLHPLSSVAIFSELSFWWCVYSSPQPPLSHDFSLY